VSVRKRGKRSYQVRVTPFPARTLPTKEAAERYELELLLGGRKAIATSKKLALSGRNSTLGSPDVARPGEIGIADTAECDLLTNAKRLTNPAGRVRPQGHPVTGDAGAARPRAKQCNGPCETNARVDRPDLL
jgi:hypothetical protein